MDTGVTVSMYMTLSEDGLYKEKVGATGHIRKMGRSDEKERISIKARHMHYTAREGLRASYLCPR